MRLADASRAFDAALRDCGTSCLMEGTVLSTSSASFSARIGTVGGKILENTVNVRIFGTADSLSEGKSVRISGMKKILSPKNGGTAYSAETVRILENGSGLLRMRKRIADSSDALYPRKESALARGLLFGDGAAISEESSLAYRNSGLSHLVVASGGNIAVVAGILAVFAKRLRFSLRALLLLSGIWGYAVLAGCGVPVVRAAMMASVALFSEPFFKTDPIPLLFSVGAAMVLWSPETAVSASFLLSFSATLGIAVLATETSGNLLMVPSGFSLRETLAATVSATVATIPVSLILFGSLPILSIVSNLAVIPFLAYAAIPTIGALVADAVGWHSVATAMGAIGYAALAWTNAVAETVAKIPFATVSPIHPPFALVGAAGGIGFLMILTFRAITAPRTDRVGKCGPAVP
ncbi:MAG: competence protein ComEC [Patescibacteria group bacterium]|nr:competence protein ComEC [Patescibacteria group bacterium]